MLSGYRSDAKGYWLLGRGLKVPVVAAGTAAASTGLLYWADVSVEMPLGSRALPLALCLPVVLALIQGYGLLDWWPSFSSTAVRISPRFRLILAVLLTFVGTAGLWPIIARTEQLPILWSFFLLLAVCQLSIVFVGTLYWIPLISVGFFLLASEMSAGKAGFSFTGWIHEPVTPYFALGSMAATTCLYGLLGPKSQLPPREEV